MARTELEVRTKQFALDLIDLVDLVERLPAGRAGDVVGRELLRSGTSIGANYREANRAESKNDFIHKVSISTKEAAETEFWLELVTESEHLETIGSSDVLAESRELLAIHTSIGRNTKKNASA